MSSRQPATVAQRVNAERLVLFGWTRAILLQFAHPLIAAGVAEHSSFRERPRAIAARLHHTISAMLALAFGTPAEYNAALEGIRAIHRRVNGTLAQCVGPFPAGTRYSAEDPDLVLWVHLTLLDSIPLVYERFVAPLTDADRDAYCRDAAPTVIALGAREDDVPLTWTAARKAIAATYTSGRIVVGPQARELARAVVAPSVPGALTWPLALNRLVTIGLLPHAIRAEYGYEWNAWDERRFARAVAVIHRARRLSPPVLAHWRSARRFAR
jgi:uncharacterized protein (DUF2236 family)